MQEPRYFSETNLSISNAKFLDYFDSRGGVNTFGFPISREFQLLGTRVQIFQRFVMQITPGGGVGLLNLLDNDMLPYTSINGANLPAFDSALAASAPAVGTAEYSTRIIDYIRSNVPDEFHGMPVSFHTTFMSPVRMEVAFPQGGDPNLLPLMNLEIWGIPTSAPTFDPKNANFVYQRFQRNVMHYDRTSGTTQGMLLGQYFKALITGEGLPSDLEREASTSRFLRQYNNSRDLGLNRPAELPGTNMLGAFEPEYAPGMPTPAPTNTPVTTSTPTPLPIVMGPSCQYDGEMLFVPEYPRAGDVVTVTVTSPTAYSSVRLAGPGSPHYIGVASGLRGYVWKWRTLVAESGLYNYDFFVNGTDLCITGFFNSGGATPTPTPTGTATPTPTSTPAPLPMVMSVSPAYPAPVHRAGGMLTIYGTNFGDPASTSNRAVYVGSAQSNIASWSDNQILAILSTDTITGTVQGYVVSRGRSSEPFQVNVID